MITRRFDEQSLIADHGGAITAVTILGWLSKIDDRPLYVELCACHITEMERRKRGLFGSKDVEKHSATIAFRHPFDEHPYMGDGLYWIFGADAKTTQQFETKPTQQQLAHFVNHFAEMAGKMPGTFVTLDCNASPSLLPLVSQMPQSQIAVFQQQRSMVEKRIEERADALYKAVEDHMQRVSGLQSSVIIADAATLDKESNALIKEREWCKQARYGYLSGLNASGCAALARRHPVWRLECDLDASAWNDCSLIPHPDSRTLICSMDAKSLSDLKYFYYVCAGVPIIVHCKGAKHKLTTEWQLDDTRLIIDVSKRPEVEKCIITARS